MSGWDLFYNLLGLLYSVVALGVAWTIYRRPLTKAERPWAAAVIAVVALAAMAYRLGKLGA